LKTQLNKRKIFNDPVHGFITIPHELIFDIIEHPYFQRLRRIKQLGFSDYVYPGALHTRFHHALGAFHLMRKALNILKIKGVKITEQEELSASIAILLHDIGHGPFSHTLEHILIPKVSHESVSKIYMKELNKQFKGKLKMAIDIFEGTYPKQFLHQLVSSQLDVDRLDYLTRDSFFTGVNEGVIAYDRIIEMFNVKDDQLVIDEKGIYSIENFLIARRLMYWQVYLHKTVLCVEQMMIKAIERAKDLIREGVKVPASDALQYFLVNDVNVAAFSKSETVLKNYSMLDDNDIICGLKAWRTHEDKILSLLANAILDRKLFKVEMREKAFSHKEIEAITKEVSKKFKVSKKDAAFLVLTDSTTNHVYNPSENGILIWTRNGKLEDIAQVSDQLNLSVLTKPVVKYYLCFPKEKTLSH